MLARRIPKTSARGREIAALSTELDALLPEVMRVLVGRSRESIHAWFGGRNADFIDIENEVIQSPEEFIAKWLGGFATFLKERPAYRAGDGYWELHRHLCGSEVVRMYVRIFLRRMYLRRFESLARKRPTLQEAELWLGSNSTCYGLFVSPRVGPQGWENDKSEIRHFPATYFTIGHVLETGLVVQDSSTPQKFRDVAHYLEFFLDRLVRPTKSPHQVALAERYARYVQTARLPLDVPLLVPELRYLGRSAKHVYRLDFVVIDGLTMKKVGFELSPWSTHGALTETSSKTESQINTEAKRNRLREIQKARDFLEQHGIAIVTFTDEDLADPDAVFSKVARSLQPQKVFQQLDVEAMDALVRLV